MASVGDNMATTLDTLAVCWCWGKTEGMHNKKECTKYGEDTVPPSLLWYLGL